MCRGIMGLSFLMVRLVQVKLTQWRVKMGEEKNKESHREEWKSFSKEYKIWSRLETALDKWMSLFLFFRFTTKKCLIYWIQTLMCHCRKDGAVKHQQWNNSKVYGSDGQKKTSLWLRIFTSSRLLQRKRCLICISLDLVIGYWQLIT